MRRVKFLAVLLLALLPAACGRRQQPARDWSAEVQQIGRKYAPDPRLAVFRVKVATEGGRTLATGEVQDPAAKRELLERLAAAGAAAVVDRIAVLPDRGLGARNCAIVNLAVGNVRDRPEHSAELVTQVLLGQTLNVLKAGGGWLYVQGPDRYLGWIDEDAVLRTDREGCSQWEEADKVVVTSRFELLRESAQKAAFPVSDLTIGDVLCRKATRGVWVEAELPDGRAGFVARESVAPYSSWKASRRATPEAVEAAARMFLGAPYLWGGTSARGFDCSGFVKTVFMLNGVDLLRDADQQARAGRDVESGPAFAKMRRGDLLFFGRKQSPQKPERIWHVGIYLSDLRFIHCSGRVRISSLDPASPQYDAGHAKDFVRARRLVGAAAGP